MGQSLKGMYGIILQKRKISQTFSIRLLTIRTKIVHYVDVVTSSHLLYGLISKENVTKKIQTTAK